MGGDLSRRGDGRYRFFTLTTAEVAALRVREDELRRISPPGSRHLRELTFDESAWRELSDNGKRCYLFYPRDEDQSRGTLQRIASGESSGVDTRYKCRSRKPWWRVPLVRVPVLLLTYMDHVRPRLAAIVAGVLHL